MYKKKCLILQFLFYFKQFFIIFYNYLDNILYSSIKINISNFLLIYNDLINIYNFFFLIFYFILLNINFII